MKSGLEGRNNPHATPTICGARTRVSMKSGLEGRNNMNVWGTGQRIVPVSMKSGLEGRNNSAVGRAVDLASAESQ